MNIEYCCGIDCGKKGALALLKKEDNNISIIEVFPMPITNKEIDCYKLADKFRQWKSLVGTCNLSFVLEKQFILAKQGGAFAVGEGVGKLEGIICTLGMSYSLVESKKWQVICKGVDIPPGVIKYYKERPNLKSTKERSIATCLSLFPDFNLLTKLGRYKDEFSDSILIAYWKLTH